MLRLALGVGSFWLVAVALAAAADVRIPPQEELHGREQDLPLIEPEEDDQLPVLVVESAQ